MIELWIVLGAFVERAKIEQEKSKSRLTGNKLKVYFHKDFSFYRNMFHKNIEAEIREILRIF